MKIMSGSKRQRNAAGLSIFLTMVVLIVGMVGCSLPPLQIRDWYDLHAIRNNLGGRYCLMNDLDSGTPGYRVLASAMANGGQGWQPIGTSGDPFSGSFDGQGYEIRDLFTDRPDEDGVGLFGLLDERGVIKNVGLVDATVAGKRYVGGLAGNNSGTLGNSYFSGRVTGDQCVGGLVGISEGTISNSYYNYDEVLINGENIITIGASFAQDFEQWLTNGKSLAVNQRLSQENGYYVINSVTDFKELLAFGQDSSLKFRLTNDLDLGSEANFYIPYLAGELDGNGHKILNLSLDFHSVSEVGLFGYLASGARVSELGVENVNVTGSYLVGGLAGGNDGTVSNSHSSGNVAGDDYVGGLMGSNCKGTVSNSYSTASVAGKWDVGGLIGTNEATLTNSYSTGGVTGWYFVGGLAGTNEGALTNSYSSSSITGWYCVGGLTGINDGTLTNSYSTGSVTGWYSVGGLIGTNSETVSNSYSIASVSGRSGVGGVAGTSYGTVRDSHSAATVAGEQDIGGLLGSNYGTLRNCYATDSVTGEWNVGGLVGSNLGTVIKSYFTGSVNGNYYVGGLVGVNDDTVSNSYSTSSVTGNRYVSGLVASNSGSVTSSYSTGSVSGSYIVSGLVGINGWDSTVSNSYSTSSASGDYYVGGLVGVNFGTVSDSYSGGNVSGDENVGGLVGVNWGGIANNSFWDTETSGQATSAGGTGRTTAEMEDTTTFLEVTWDICPVAPGATNPACTWNIVHQQTYPFLSWQSAD
jgi:hypothetical protein